MSFYQQFSKYYDYIFPTGKSQIDFIDYWMRGKETILDIACATGGYSIELAKKGYSVKGIDLDEAMIKTAIEKSQQNNQEIDFKAGDMKEVNQIYSSKFQGAFCIGNSLVHLRDMEEIQLALGAFNRILDREGLLIIQNINYDRILDRRIDGLPTIEDKEHNISFVRKYRYLEDSNRISFDTTLSVGDGQSFNNSILLYPLRQRELERVLIKTGYKVLGYFGSFNKDDIYNSESYGLIVVARKIG